MAWPYRALGEEVGLTLTQVVPSYSQVSLSEAVPVDPPKRTTRPRPASYAMPIELRAGGDAVGAATDQVVPSRSKVLFDRCVPDEIPPKSTKRERRPSHTMA